MKRVKKSSQTILTLNCDLRVTASSHLRFVYSEDLQRGYLPFWQQESGQIYFRLVYIHLDR